MKLMREAPITSVATARALASVLLLSFFAVSAACSVEERTLVAPEPVATRDVVFRIVADAEAPDQAAATALGWSDGIPGVEVSLATSDSVTLTATSDAQGRIVLSDVPVGPFTLQAKKVLSAAERASVSGESDVVGFVGESFVTIDAANISEIEVRTPAAFRRGLMLSEYAFKRAMIAGLGTYYFGGYLELYNNGEETVYLDGLQLADATSFGASYVGSNFTCESVGVQMEDSGGIWTRYLVAFPGSGSDYPVEPGGTVVVAMDAIDHRGLFPDQLDLSNADFEMPGGPDNPAVPDMINLSVGHNPIHTHGPMFDAWNYVTAVLAAPADPSTFATNSRVTNGVTFNTIRIPAAGLIDVMTSSGMFYLNYTPPGRRLCPRFVNQSFDRGYGFHITDSETTSSFDQGPVRKVLFVDENGRPVLQHSRNSAVDWKTGPRTPGVIAP